MLVVTNNLHDVNELKIMLGKEFDMKDLGIAKKIMIWKFKISAKKVWLSQKSYVEKVLDKFDMSNSKVVSNVLENHFKLSLVQFSKRDAEVGYMSNVPYVSVVGC